MAAITVCYLILRDIYLCEEIRDLFMWRKVAPTLHTEPLQARDLAFLYKQALQTIVSLGGGRVTLGGG